MEWINVKDRLPSKYGYYLTFSTQSRGVSIKANYQNLRYYPKEKKFTNHVGRINDFEPVTHWMPLPEPPKE